VEWDGGIKPAEPLPTTIFQHWSSNKIHSTVYTSNVSTIAYSHNVVGQLVCEKPIGKI